MNNPFSSKTKRKPTQKITTTKNRLHAILYIPVWCKKEIQPSTQLKTNRKKIFIEKVNITIIL